MTTAQMIMGGLYRLKTKEEIDILHQESEEEYIKLKICPSSHDEYRVLASFVRVFLKKFGIEELTFLDPDEWSQYLTIEFTNASQDKNEIINLIKSLGFWACLDGDDGFIDLADVDLNILKLIFSSESFSFKTESVSQKAFDSVTPKHFYLEINKQPEIVECEISKERKERKKRETGIQKPVEEIVSLSGEEKLEAIIAVTDEHEVPSSQKLIETDISLPFSITLQKSIKSLSSLSSFLILESGNLSKKKNSLIDQKKIFDIRKVNIRESFEDAFAQEHQRELFRIVEGIEYWNDSGAVNINRAWFTLEIIEKPIIWITGEIDKESDYELILKLAKQKVISLILLGQDTSRVGIFFQGIVPEITRVTSIMQAVQIAHRKARSGDAVVFSPACQSFDLFENYEDRGRQFKQAVWFL